MTLRELKNRLYNLLPGKAKYRYSRLKASIKMALKGKRELQRVRQEVDHLQKQLSLDSQPLRVLFLVHDHTMWKYDSLYRRMESDPSFEPHILVFESVNLPDGPRQELYQRTLAHFTESPTPYRVMGTRHQEQVEALHPHLIFYTTPYDSLLPTPYQMRHRYSTSLLCYSNYGYSIEDRKEWYDAYNFGLLWRYYAPNEIDQQLYQKYSPIHGANSVVVGAPKLDLFRHATPTHEQDPQSPQKPLIIIAPHHSIEPYGYALSNFLRYADLFLTLPQRYQGRVRWAFKPHPILKEKLYQHPQWGPDRTDAYYHFWETTPDCTLELGDYVSLFSQSSAMIHDCSAFTVEYALLGKPALFMVKREQFLSNLNEVGRSAIQLHTLAYSEEDILRFIEALLASQAEVNPEQLDHFRKLVLPNGSREVAEWIVEDIKRNLNRQ